MTFWRGTANPARIGDTADAIQQRRDIDTDEL